MVFRKKKGLLSAFLALTALLLTLSVPPAEAANSNTFTFTNDGVTASDETADGYKISGTALTIQAAGTYTITGSCANGSITVKKEITGVTLNLQNLTLASTDTAPLSCNKSSETTLNVTGTVTLTDKEDPENENSTDADVAEAFDGAAIKVKSGASLTIKGSGTLTADGSACKNGIKGAATAAVTVAGNVKLSVKAANNGIASEGSVNIDGGSVTVSADGDGLKSEPEDGDTDSAGTVTINAGTLTINAGDDGVQATNGVTVTGGSLDITSVGDGIKSDGDVTVKAGAVKIRATGEGGDGIQTAKNLNISGGAFDIMTYGGAANASALGDNSAKGLKASSDDETPTNTITLSGGTFTLDTADDAIHSDCDVTITGGQFDITTGDDGAHADSTLTLGSSGGKDPVLRLTVSKSYEALEGNIVNILSGCYDVTASDDGINAAGGSSSGSDPGGPFGPGGNGGGPGGDRFRARVTLLDGAQLLADTPAVNISGGVVKVNAGGDGLDSNGALNLTGGNIVVWGQEAGHDNEPLDYDGTLTVKGATVFAAGGRGMGMVSPASGSQTHIYSTNTIASGNTINVKDASSTVVCGLKAVKNVNYVFYSSPSVTSNWSVTSGSTREVANCDVTGHAWDDGKETVEATCTSAGTILYTCAVCGDTESVTIPATGHHYVSGVCTNCGEADPNASGSETETDGYTVTFQTGSHASVKVYKTQTVSDATLDASGTYYARHADTGNIVTSGAGQINFLLELDDGCTLQSVTASPEGSYGAVVVVDASRNLYRVTKITGDITVTVTVETPVSKAGFFYTLDGASATVQLGYEDTDGPQANGAYLVALGWYDEDGIFLKFQSVAVTLDADKYAEFTTEFPETFDKCYAFLLDADEHYIPQASKAELSPAS